MNGNQYSNERYQNYLLVHTWLAWQEKPGRPIGLAITARYFDATASHAQQLIDWARRLFELEPI